MREQVGQKSLPIVSPSEPGTTSLNTDTPPAFKDFKFQVIGQMPELLKRFSAPRPNFRYRSRSPNPTKSVTDSPSVLRDSTEIHMGEPARQPSRSTNFLTEVERESHLSQRSTASPLRSESLQLQYPSPTPAPSLTRSTPFHAQSVKPEPLPLQNTSPALLPATISPSDQASSALQMAQQSYTSSFVSAQSSLESANSTFTDALPIFETTLSSFAHTAQSLITAESSIDTSEGALEAAEKAFGSAQSAFEAANKAMAEAFSALHMAKQTMQAAKETFRSAKEEHGKSEVTFRDVRGVWSNATTALEDAGVLLSRAEEAEVQRIKIDREIRHKEERERESLEGDAKAWRKMENWRAEEERKRKEEADERSRKEREDAEKQAREARDRDARLQQEKILQERQAQEEIQRQEQEEEKRRQIDYETKRHEVMLEKEKATLENAARIKAKRSGAQATSPLPSPASASPPPASLNKTGALSGGVALSVPPKERRKPTVPTNAAVEPTSSTPPSASSTKKDAGTSFVSAQTNEGRQVSTDSPMYPIEMASEAKRSINRQPSQHSHTETKSASRSKSPPPAIDPPLNSSPSPISLFPAEPWQPEPGDTEMPLLHPHSTGYQQPTHAQILTNLRHLTSSDAIQQPDSGINSAGSGTARESDLKIGPTRAEMDGRDIIVPKQEINEDDCVDLGTLQTGQTPLLAANPPTGSVTSNQTGKTPPKAAPASQVQANYVSHNSRSPLQDAPNQSSPRNGSSPTSNTAPAKKQSAIRPPRPFSKINNNTLELSNPGVNSSGELPESISPLIGDGGWADTAVDHGAYPQRAERNSWGKNDTADVSRRRVFDHYSPPHSPLPADGSYTVPGRDVSGRSDYSRPVRTLPRRRSDHYSPPYSQPLAPAADWRRHDHYSPPPNPLQSRFNASLPRPFVSPPPSAAGQKRLRDDSEWAHEYPARRAWLEAPDDPRQERWEFEHLPPAPHRERRLSGGGSDDPFYTESGALNGFGTYQAISPPQLIGYDGSNAMQTGYRNIQESQPLKRDPLAPKAAEARQKQVIYDRSTTTELPFSRQPPARKVGTRGVTTDHKVASAPYESPSVEGHKSNIQPIDIGLLARLSDKVGTGTRSPNINKHTSSKTLSDRMQPLTPQPRGRPRTGRGTAGNRLTREPHLKSMSPVPSLQKRLGLT